MFGSRSDNPRAFGYETTTLIISNNEYQYKVQKKQFKMKQKKIEFLGMLLCTLGARLLGNL